jgi:hypothetical protein
MNGKASAVIWSDQVSSAPAKRLIDQESLGIATSAKLVRFAVKHGLIP